MESKTHFCGEAVKVKRAKVLGEDFIAGRTWSSAKFFVLKNDTAIADRSVPLILENL